MTRDRWRQLARKRESAKGEDGSKFLSCAVVPQLRQPMNHERVVMKIWAGPTGKDSRERSDEQRSCAFDSWALLQHGKKGMGLFHATLFSYTDRSGFMNTNYNLIFIGKL